MTIAKDAVSLKKRREKIAGRILSPKANPNTVRSVNAIELGIKILMLQDKRKLPFSFEKTKKLKYGS